MGGQVLTKNSASADRGSGGKDGSLWLGLAEVVFWVQSSTCSPHARGIMTMLSSSRSSLTS